MPTLTVFTPTYNRVHTLCRTYSSLMAQTSSDFSWLIIDDGSSDSTKQWVERLGEKITTCGRRFNWMGREESGDDGNHFIIDNQKFQIEYVYKPNGGLYTGYNTAYSIIETELCVCVDSDDYLPDNAVETILDHWHSTSIGSREKYCGLIGLDFNAADKKPIGGYFPSAMHECNVIEIESRRVHVGDTKEVMRTELMREVSPMYGFEGEKNFNPWYLIMQVADKYPMLVINDNLCWVDYQTGRDSMSQGIWKQYYDSPRSFAKYRLMCMTLKHITLKDRLRNIIHYVSSCLIAKDRDWLKKSPFPVITFLLAPLGVILSLVVKYKNV